MTLVATATIGAKKWRAMLLSTPTKMMTGDIPQQCASRALAIEPGENRFTVDIERQGKFAGRVPIEVKNCRTGSAR